MKSHFLQPRLLRTTITPPPLCGKVKSPPNFPPGPFEEAIRFLPTRRPARNAYAPRPGARFHSHTTIEDIEFHHKAELEKNLAAFSPSNLISTANTKRRTSRPTPKKIFAQNSAEFANDLPASTRPEIFRGALKETFLRPRREQLGSTPNASKLLD